MDNVIAKFQCVGIEDHPEYQQKSVNFSPVINDCEENRSFAKYTPSGNIRMNISYETPASNYFKLGKDYLVNFEEV